MINHKDVLIQNKEYSITWTDPYSYTQIIEDYSFIQSKNFIYIVSISDNPFGIIAQSVTEDGKMVLESKEIPPRNIAFKINVLKIQSEVK